MVNATFHLCGAARRGCSAREMLGAGILTRFEKYLTRWEGKVSSLFKIQGPRPPLIIQVPLHGLPAGMINGKMRGCMLFYFGRFSSTDRTGVYMYY